MMRLTILLRVPRSVAKETVTNLRRAKGGSDVNIALSCSLCDGGVDLLPIGGLLKSEVRVLARELGVPERIIAKPPTAGAVPAKVAERIDQLRTSSDHKRNLPPVAPT